MRAAGSVGQHRSCFQCRAGFRHGDRQQTSRPFGTFQNLEAIEIDPEAAAAQYREQIVGPMRGVLPEKALKSIEEQLSGACTTEIAAFDEFTALLTDRNVIDRYDHVVFDTAPTGHTIRLLKLPGAWTGFLEAEKGDASCLGPLSGLQKQRDRYAAAVEQTRQPSINAARPGRAARAIRRSTRSPVQRRSWRPSASRISISRSMARCPRSPATTPLPRRCATAKRRRWPAWQRNCGGCRARIFPFARVIWSGSTRSGGLLWVAGTTQTRLKLRRSAPCSPPTAWRACRRDRAARQRSDYADGQGRRRQNDHSNGDCR